MKTEVDVFQYKAGVDFLKGVYSQMRNSNPRFSRRAFAVKLGMDQSMLTRYFGGVRLLASERVEEIAKRLELGNVEAQYFKVISLLGDRGELDILDKLRKSFLLEKTFDLNQVLTSLCDAGWLQNTSSEWRQKILKKVFPMVSHAPEAGPLQTGTIDNSQVEIFNQMISIHKDDRALVQKSLQDLRDLLASVRTEKGDDFIVVSTVMVQGNSHSDTKPRQDPTIL